MVQAYKNNSEAGAQAAVSQSSDQSFGSQTLSQLDKSVRSAFEPGAALVQISFMRSCPDHLVYTNGHIEPVTDPMKRAWVFKNREAFLANRVIHSLDDQSVLMSDEDYEAVRKLVSAAMVDTGEQASRVIQDYSKALESLEEARRRQLATSQDSKFALDLSKQPYSMRRQTKPSWPRDDASRAFCSWAWRQVHEEHSRVPGTTVSLSLENSDLDLAPFTTDNGRRLRSRLQESAKLYWNAREIEDECFNSSAMPLKDTRRTTILFVSNGPITTLCIFGAAMCC